MKKPIVITCIYLVFGFVWIYLSDYFLFRIVSDIDYLQIAQNYKGFAFVVVSSVLLLLAQLVTYRNILHIKSEEIVENLSRNALLKKILNSIPFGLAVFKLDSGNPLIVSNSFFAAIDWPSGGIHNLDEMLSQVFLSETQFTDFKKKTSTRKLEYFKWENQLIKTRKNEPRTVSLHLVQLHDLNLVVSMCTDKSGILQNRNQLEMALDVSSIGTWVFDLVNYRTVNNNWVTMLGYQPDELSRNLNDFLGLLHPDDQSTVQQTFEEITQGKRHEFLLEIRLKTKSGDFNWIQSRGKITLYDRKGVPAQISGVHIDITWQKRSEEQLKNYAHRLNAAIEGAELGVWDMNAATGDNHVNDQFWTMLGYDSNKKYSYESFTDLLHPEDKHLPLRELSRIESGGENKMDLTIRMKHKDGGYRIIMDRGKVVEFDKNGKVRRMIGTHQDITKIKLNEQNLEARESSIRNIANNIEGAIFQYVLNADGTDKFTFMTDGIERLFEVSKEQALEDTSCIWNLINASYVPNMIESIKESAEKLTTWNQIYQFTTPSGKEKWAHGMGTPRKGENGSTIWDTLLLDITTQHINKTKLEEYSKSLAKAQEIGKMGYWEWIVDSDEVKWSEEVYNIYEIKPQLAPPSMPELMEYMDNKESREMLQMAIDKSIKTGESYYANYKIKTKHGSKYINAIGYVYADEQSKVTKLQGIVQDVTEQKKLEIDLFEQKEYLRILTEHASDGILTCDENGNLEFYNMTLKKWLGLEHESKMPRKWPKDFRLYSFDGLSLLKPTELALARALKGENIVNARFMIKSMDKERLVETNGSAMFDANGEKIGAILVIRDITERYHQELQMNNAFLEGMEQERQSLASEIHDNLSQNLGIVSMNLNNLVIENRELAKVQRIQKSMEFIDKSIEQSRNIAHTLMPKTLSDFGLIGAVAELIEMHNEIESFKIELLHNNERRLSSECELHLFRIIQESIRNIRKHANAKSCTISILFDQNQVSVSILDDGRGFDTNPGRRTGIGLKIIENRVLKLQGELDIESEKGGTSIFIKIPIS